MMDRLKDKWARGHRWVGLVSCAVVGAGALVAGGCAGHPAPVLSVQDIALTERSMDAAILTITVSASNPGEEALPLRRVNYTLWLDGKRAASVERTALYTLSGGGEAELSLPASIDPALLSASEGTRYRVSGSVVYELPGAIAEMLFDNNLRRPSASFSASGTLTLAP